MGIFDEIMDFYPGNRVAYGQLLKRLKDKHVIPFIGAGLSTCCYPTWEKLLYKLLKNVSDACAQKVTMYIKSYDYFTAADMLCDEMGELLFYECFRDAFDENIITKNKIKDQAVFLLPQFQLNTYITTNYDRVLEKAFDYNGVGFEIGFPYDTYRLTTYMRDNSTNPMIMKIHGDIRSNNHDLILTGKSYKLHYSDGANLKTQLSKWADSKIFLFIGASLYQDQTISLIADQMQEGMINYAIMGVSSSEIIDVKKRVSHVNALPIFYDRKDHGNLTIVLQQLLNDL